MTHDPCTDGQETLPFHLTGNYAPVMDELTVHDLPVIGTIPAELAGTYVRNGPNPRHGPTPTWFLGQGMLHGVRLANGRAHWYRNRWVQAPTTSNTNIVRHAGQMLALVETAPPVLIGDELQTLGTAGFTAGLTRGMTAHPKTCPKTGELLFFAYGLEAPHLNYYRAGVGGELLQSEAIEVARATYMHDFAITPRFALFFDLPVLFNGWRQRVPIEWSDSYGARIGVLPRTGPGEAVRWFEIAACTISHTVNAFEEGSKVLIDVVRARDLNSPTQLCRYSLDLDTGRADEQVLDARFLEFPRIDDRLTGLAHRYIYALELSDVINGAPSRSVVRKFDLATGASTIHDFGSDRVSGECVFVPRGPGSHEDDGFVLSYVYDRQHDKSELVICDAGDFGAPALARVPLPARVPFGIHGNWFADESAP